MEFREKTEEEINEDAEDKDSVKRHALEETKNVKTLKVGRDEFASTFHQERIAKLECKNKETSNQ